MSKYVGRIKIDEKGVKHLVLSINGEDKWILDPKMPYTPYDLSDMLLKHTYRHCPCLGDISKLFTGQLCKTIISHLRGDWALTSDQIRAMVEAIKKGTLE